MQSVVPIQVTKVASNSGIKSPDLLAVEEPMEIRLIYGPSQEREQKSLAITMRTPGQVLELVMGFLFTEGIISSPDEIVHIEHCKDAREQESDNVVRVELVARKKLDWASLQRHFYTNSSCGVCGKASIESLRQLCPAPLPAEGMVLSPELVSSLPGKMRDEQRVFEHTGGLHAAALFDARGELLLMREDIGRHNALDKVIGAALFQRMVPLSSKLIVLSGRSCFELVQKGLMAGVPLMASVGAPSSLAVKTAEASGMTLLGFVKNHTFNVYSGSQRIHYEDQDQK